MDYNAVLDELHQELKQSRNALNGLANFVAARPTLKKVTEGIEQDRVLIENAVIALDALARAKGKRRGRRPAWIEDVRAAHGKTDD